MATATATLPVFLVSGNGMLLEGGVEDQSKCRATTLGRFKEWTPGSIRWLTRCCMQNIFTPPLRTVDKLQGCCFSVMDRLDQSFSCFGVSCLGGSCLGGLCLGGSCLSVSSATHASVSPTPPMPQQLQQHPCLSGSSNTHASTPMPQHLQSW